MLSWDFLCIANVFLLVKTSSGAETLSRQMCGKHGASLFNRSNQDRVCQNCTLYIFAEPEWYLGSPYCTSECLVGFDFVLLVRDCGQDSSISSERNQNHFKLHKQSIMQHQVSFVLHALIHSMRKKKKGNNSNVRIASPMWWPESDSACCYGYLPKSSKNLDCAYFYPVIRYILTIFLRSWWNAKLKSILQTNNPPTV